MKHALASGARVIVDPLEDAPVTALYLHVCAGSADERPGEHGAAHFLEHVAFKGAPGLGVGEVAAAVEAMGGDINAYTTCDRTVFHATVPTPRWREALEVLVAMTLRCTLDPDEVEVEREVILDELRGGEDDPDRCLSEAVAARAWGAHPYARPVIGTEASLPGLDARALAAFHARHYQPGNLILSVSGGADPAEVIAEAGRLLAGPSAPAPRDARPPLAPWTGCQEVLLRGHFQEPILELVFQGVPHDHPDAPALDLLFTALGSGSGSILGEALQLDEGLVTGTWGAVESERDGGLLTLGCSPRAGRLREALKAMATALRRALTEGPGVEALRRARARVLAERLFEAETVDGRAHERAWFEDVAGDPEAARAYRVALEAVTAADLRRVARRWLTLDRCLLAACLPESEPGTTGLLRLLGSAPLPAPAPRPPIHRALLRGGLTLVVEPREQSAIVAIQAVTMGGQLVERPANAGLTELWSRAVGVEALDAVDLARWLDTRGAEFDGVAGRSSMGLRCELPAEHVDDAIWLVSEALRWPRFDEEDVARSLDDLAEDERTLSDDPAAQAAALGEAALYGPHPYGLPVWGSARSRARLGVPALERLHRRRFTAGELVIAVVGAVEPEAVRERFERALEDLPEGPSLLPRRSPARFPARRRALRPALAREQAHVLLLWPGARFSDPDAEALNLAATVLGGQAGRLFLALRERRGLAYHVSAESSEGWDPGHLACSMTADPARVDEALAGLRAEVERLAAEGPSPEELDRARAATLGSLAMGRQRSGSRASELAWWERYGRDARQVRPHIEALYRAVTPEQARQALARRLAASPGVEVVLAAPGRPAR